MKKYILSVVAVAAFASYNVYQSNNETEGMSDTMLANVEALAGGESVENIKCNREIEAVCILINNIHPIKGERY